MRVWRRKGRGWKEVQKRLTETYRPPMCCLSLVIARSRSSLLANSTKACLGRLVSK